MRTTIVLLLFLITSIAYSAEPYTVVLKNGKAMKGQLLSETEELIVFKDDKGLQYSLKKSLLDLEKMKEANEPLPPPEVVTPPEEVPPESSPIPQPKEITEPDQTPASPSESVIQPAESTTEIQPPEEIRSTEPGSISYFTTLREGADKLESVFEEVGSYLDGMMTAWEVNASTGRDPTSALREFKANKGASLTVSIDAHLQVLENVRERLNDPPVQYLTAYDAFSSCLRDLIQYYDAVRQFEGKPAITVFRSRLNASEENIQKKIDELKATKQ